MKIPTKTLILITLILIVLGLGVVAVIYGSYIAEWNKYRIKPLKLKPIYKWNDPLPSMKYVPIYEELAGGDGPAIEIVPPSPHELGFVGKLVSVQLYTKLPYRKIELKDVMVDKTHGIIKIYVDRGTFANVLSTWLKSRPQDIKSIEIPIEVNLWYQDVNGSVHYAFTVVHWNPQEISSIKANQVLKVKPFRVLLHPNHIKPGQIAKTLKTSKLRNQGNVDFECTYKWRHNCTWIDTERDLDGWIPILAIRNDNQRSATLSMSIYITTSRRVWNEFTLVFGTEVGPAEISISDIYTYQWDLKYNERKIVRENLKIFPGHDYVLYVKGRATIDAYYEYQACRDAETGERAFEVRTGNVKFQTDVFYIGFDTKGYAVAKDGDSIGDISTFLGNATAALDKRLNYGDTIELAYYLDEYMKQHCNNSSTVSVGAPVGMVAVETLKLTGKPVAKSIA